MVSLLVAAKWQFLYSCEIIHLIKINARLMLIIPQATAFLAITAKCHDLTSLAAAGNGHIYVTPIKKLCLYLPGSHIRFTEGIVV